VGRVDLAQAIRDKTESKILANIAAQFRRLANHKEKMRERGSAPLAAKGGQAGDG
jgi:hypothetical protein